MKWEDTAIVLKAKRHGENSWIVSLLTLERGRHMGIARVSHKNLSVVQPGNYVHARWSARLPDHLGTWSLELLSSPLARLCNHPFKLMALTASLTLLDSILPERHPYPPLYETLRQLIGYFEGISTSEQHCLFRYCQFELQLLEQMGYGLDLSKCTVTGQKEDLVFVSPKTGRAVCGEAGSPFQKKLLLLPGFLTGYLEEGVDVDMPVTYGEFKKALFLTGYFLSKYFFESQLPESRERLEQWVAER